MAAGRNDKIDLQVARAEEHLARLKARRQKIRAREAAEARRAGDRVVMEVGRMVVERIGGWKDADLEALDRWLGEHAAEMEGLAWNGSVDWADARDRAAAWAERRKRSRADPDGAAEADAADAEALAEECGAEDLAALRAEAACMRPWLLPAIDADPERYATLLAAKREAEEEEALSPAGAAYGVRDGVAPHPEDGGR